MPIYEYRIDLPDGTHTLVEKFFHNRANAHDTLELEYEGRIYTAVRVMAQTALMGEQWGVAAGTRGLNKKTANRMKPSTRVKYVPHPK
jgi:hypothetical protein